MIYGFRDSPHYVDPRGHHCRLWMDPHTTWVDLELSLAVVHSGPAMVTAARRGAMRVEDEPPSAAIRNVAREERGPSPCSGCHRPHGIVVKPINGGASTHWLVRVPARELMAAPPSPCHGPLPCSPLSPTTFSGRFRWHSRVMGRKKEGKYRE
jgi:hypothetical protein